MSILKKYVISDRLLRQKFGFLFFLSEWGQICIYYFSEFEIWFIIGFRYECLWQCDITVESPFKSTFQKTHNYYYPFKKYVEYIFLPGCRNVMSRSVLRFWLAAWTIASFVFVGDCLKQFKTINTNNRKLEWFRHSFSTFLFWSSLDKYQL